MNGRIITIEGLDGAGKSTQIDLLVERCKSLGVKHKFIHFPMLNQGVYGSLVAEYLRGEFGSLEDVHPKLVALLFAEDRKEHRETLAEWLEEGYFVIMDRYVYSNIAYQCAKTKDDEGKRRLKEWILEFEFQQNALPRADQSFYLDVPFHVVQKSLSQTRKGEDRTYLEGKTDIHEDSIELQRHVRQEYLQLVEEEPDFQKIDCCADTGAWLRPQEIHERIFSRIKAGNEAVFGNQIF